MALKASFGDPDSGWNITFLTGLILVGWPHVIRGALSPRRYSVYAMIMVVFFHDKIGKTWELIGICLLFNPEL
jgi:hypothetical protein